MARVSQVHKGPRESLVLTEWTEKMVSREIRGSKAHRAHRATQELKDHKAQPVCPRTR
jgi:hypothetical protein